MQDMSNTNSSRRPVMPTRSYTDRRETAVVLAAFALYSVVLPLAAITYL